MKKINLSVIERLKMVQLLSEFRGGLDKLAVVLDDIKKVSLSEQERSDVDLKTVVENDVSMLKWDSTKENLVATEIELQDITVDFLREKLSKGEFGIADVVVFKINEKIK